MPAHHLPANRFHHVLEVECLLLVSHLRVIDDLQQKIAKLLGKRRHVPSLDGVGDLIGFLDRIGSDGLEILLEVPRTAAAGPAQLAHDRQERPDRTEVGGEGVERLRCHECLYHAFVWASARKPWFRHSHKIYYGK